MDVTRLLLIGPFLLLAPQPAPAAERAATIRVGNLANKGELARFERRVWEGCGKEARISIERYPSDKPPGRVIGQHPPRGTRIGCDRASAILQVSAGPAEARLYVPALVEPAQRRAFARDLRAVCGTPVAITETRRPSALPPGRFVDQSPGQGMRYRCGTPIEVRLSAGPRGSGAKAKTGGAANVQTGGATKAPAQEAQLADALPREARATTPGRSQLPAPAAAASLQPAAQPPVEQRAAAPAAQPAPPAVTRTRDRAPIPATPAQSPRFGILGPNLLPLLLLLLLAVLLVPLSLRRRRAPPAATAPTPAPTAAPRTPPTADRTARPPQPIAPLLALERGWPAATARLLPPARVPAGPPVDALPPVPLLRDFLRPLDPALDWIAATPLAALGSPAPQTPPPEHSETLAPLRADFAEALRFALLFELPPLLARAWATAPELPFTAAGPRRGWCQLDPHSIALTITPDLALTAAGVPVARPALHLRLTCTFLDARIFLRGTALDAFDASALHVSATLDWAGQTRPLAMLRPHAAWPGQQAVTPPLQLHALPGLKAVG